MHITIACIGRLKGAEREMCDRYLSRINGAGKQVSIDGISIREFVESKKKTSDARKADEAALLLGKLPDQQFFFCLDEKGKNFSTIEFSNKIQILKEDGLRNISFILGGADGLSAEILRQASGKISLGAMTMPHGLARVVLLEQLYRIMTIWSGHPYHRV